MPSRVRHWRKGLLCKHGPAALFMVQRLGCLPPPWESRAKLIRLCALPHRPVQAHGVQLFLLIRTLFASNEPAAALPGAWSARGRRPRDGFFKVASTQTKQRHMTDDNALIAAFTDHQGVKDAGRTPVVAGSSPSLLVSGSPSLPLSFIAVRLLFGGLSTGAIAFFLRFSSGG